MPSELYSSSYIVWLVQVITLYGLAYTNAKPLVVKKFNSSLFKYCCVLMFKCIAVQC